MKIIHILKGRCNPESANGVEKTAFCLSKTQGALGHDVRLFSISNKDAIAIPNVSVEMFRPGWNCWGYKALCDRIEAYEPEVIHFHSAFVPEFILIAKNLRRKGVPYVVTPNGVLSPRLLRRRFYLKIPFRYGLELPYIRRASLLHAVSDEEMKMFRWYRLNVPAVVIRNGIEIGDKGSGSQRRLLRQMFPRIGERKVFLFIGRLDIEQKGLDLLLNAFACCRTDLAGAVLVVLGTDWKGGRKRLERMVKRKGLVSQVFVGGGVFGSEKWDVLKEAWVFVHFSRWEGLPFAVLEALSCGVPCLVSRPTNLGELVDSYDAGCVVSNELGDCCCGLRGMGGVSSSRWAEVSENARSLVRSEFDWRILSEQMVTSYSVHCARD